jgi:hypothetical protein
MRRSMPLRSSHSWKASSALVICVSWSMSAPTMKVGLGRGDDQALEGRVGFQAGDEFGKRGSQRLVQHVHGPAGHVDGDQADAVGVDLEGEGLRMLA